MAQLSVILILSHGSDEIVIIVHELPLLENAMKIPLTTAATIRRNKSIVERKIYYITSIQSHPITSIDCHFTAI